ncbi:abl interactor 1-like [Amphibalanus amphitrite]|uniref:abl interactor 1-like n=1 Tax=Amphibalanus amphitrite TaxID=1232801 RepID=UPI001C903C15|nr:abl interactor 1-like [Amphibalanus amphitrite]
MMADLHSLIVQEIPKGRQDLIDSHTNLERVAEYCEANYIDSENRRGALEETKNFTTQSLASVAYQINTLAYNFIQMLDLQQQQISDMGSQITNIAQTVMVHKEKVARREIGVLTTNKTSTRQFKIIAPVNPERPIKYVRKPIDFGALDDIGHGVRVHGGSAGMARPVRQNSTSSQGSSGAASAGGGGVYASGPAPTTKPPTPPQPARSASTLSRNNKEYRTPPAIAPPQVPSNYAVNYPMGHPRRQEAGRAPGYSAVPRPAGPPPASPAPQVGMVHPMHHEQPTAAPGAGGESIYRSRSQRGSENGEPAYRPGMRMPSSSGMSVSAASTGGRSSTSSIQSYGGMSATLPGMPPASARSSGTSIHCEWAAPAAVGKEP